MPAYRQVCVQHQTSGKKGAVGTDGKKILIKPHKLKVVNKSGAGDAFTSGFAYGKLKKWDLRKSMRMGACCAERVIALPDRIIDSKKEVMKKMRKYKWM